MSPRPGSLLLALLSACSPAPRAPGHVVLISVDTLRADHVGAYGSAVETPHIDALAADGVRFSRAWPAATTTLPSHAAMVTGRLPRSHGVPHNGAILHERNTTLAEVLRGHAFTTLGVVGGVPVAGSTGMAQGFDAYQGPLSPGAAGNAAVAALLDAHAGARTFLFVHYWDAHWPYTPPPPWDRKYRTDSIPMSGSFAQIKRLRADLAASLPGAPARSAAMKGAYAGAVSYTDSHVGQLLADLKQRGVYNNALIVLTADHGEGMDEHWDLWSHGESTYEAATHVPLIIKMPGQRRAGSVVDTPVSLVDLFPTVLDALGVPLPGPVDGTSLLPALRGQPLERGPLLVEASGPGSRDTNCMATLDGSLKYHHCGWRGAEELYDLSADPTEQHNQMGSVPASAARSVIEAARQAPASPVQRDTRPETAAALEALGYVVP